MIIHGRNLIITAGGVAIAAAKSCSIDVDAEMLKVASADDGQWEHSIPGRKSWDVTTNHLLTSITDGAEMVGTTVTLRAKVSGEVGLPFREMVTGVTIEQDALEVEPTAVVWDTTTKQFLAWVRTTRPAASYYYNQWPSATAYNSAAAGTLFYMNGTNANDVYKKTATDLVLEALQGTAIVKKWQAAGAVNSLATGAFRFEGSGPFTRPTT